MPLMKRSADYVMRSVLGHTFKFNANVAINVPEALVPAAKMIGAVLCENETDIPLVKDNEPKPLEKAPEGDKRAESIKEAIKVVTKKNDSNDFTSSGRPKLTVIKSMTGFDVTSNELKTHWEAWSPDKNE